jgi:hypothetical protein
MIAEILYELKNIHIIGQRVLDTENAKVEPTITASGNFRGIPIIETTTFWIMPTKSNKNVLYGEANGALVIEYSKEFAIFRGHGLTFILEKGNVRDRGARIYHTSSGKLSYLNNLVGLFEYDMCAHLTVALALSFLRYKT